MPRCRSLWLSQLLSFGDSYCFHEYLSNCEVEPTLPILDGFKSVGSCDTYPLGFNADTVHDSPLLIIHRPLHEVKSALQASFGYMPDTDRDKIIDHMYDKLISIKTNNKLMVKFTDFGDISKVKYIIKFMGLNIPDFHIHKIMGSKITVDNSNINLSNHALNLHNGGH